MKHLLPLIMIIHGLIHLIGLFKKGTPEVLGSTFDLTTIALDKNAALIASLSLVACSLFIAAAIGYYLDKTWWLVVALGAILFSQVLIIFSWKDAKWGTILNLLIMAGVIVGFAQRRFQSMVKSEVSILYQGVSNPEKTIITKEMLTPLPAPVRTWLMNSGIVGKQRIRTVHLHQNGSIRLKPGQQDWTAMRAEQYFNIDQPSFIWEANMAMMPGITIRARDKYMNGHGEMKIKLLSLIPIANSTGREVDQGTLQRWLAEICWFPSAALSPFITWQPINNQSALATMTYKGASGSVIFYFDAKGDITKCTADRCMSSGNKMSLEKWEVNNTGYAVFHGIRIPVKSEVTWKLEKGDFTWAKLEITNIEYDSREGAQLLNAKVEREG